MRFKRFKQFLHKKNLSPMNNRKKVGIILFATSIGLFFLFAARLSYIVIAGQVAGTSLKAKTEALYQGSKVVEAKRGTIYDRNGNVIAEDATSYTVKAITKTTYMIGSKKLYAQPKDFEKLAEILHDQLNIDKKLAMDQLEIGHKNDGFEVLFGQSGKNISLDKKKKIEQAMKDAGVVGLYFDEHPDRIYPNGIFSSHFIGYAESEVDKNGVDQGLVGRLGLEAAYDDILKGKDGKIVYQNDNYQNPLPGTVAEEKKAVDGQDIYTTLDIRLQTYLESLLDKSAEKYKPENMTAMLVEAKTGEIVAMGQRPTFNPETKAEINKDGFEWMNLLVQDRYEPGSTMKVMTTAAAINEGVFNENETFTSGEIKVGDTLIRDHDLGEKGILTMRQALSWSSNVGMVKLEEKLGGSRWTRYLKQFGFGQSTYSGLPGENAGTLPTDNIVDQAMSAFGQAIGVTNFQMMRAFTAIANDGEMLEPRYISKIVGPTGEERVTQKTVAGKPITKETAAKVREYMRDVIESENYGSAYGYYDVPGVHIAAKTGTAQIASEKGGYLTGDNPYLHSIVEMVPAEDPEYILYMTMKLPENWSQEALASIGNPLLKRALDFKETDEQPVSADKTEKVTVADYRNLATDTAASDASKQGLTPIVIGTGEKVKAQSTESGTELLPSEKLILTTTGDEYYMPDVTGWSKNDLIKLSQLLKIEISFTGEGYCTKQSLAPYEKITNEKISFTLE